MLLHINIYIYYMSLFSNIRYVKEQRNEQHAEKHIILVVDALPLGLPAGLNNEA